MPKLTEIPQGWEFPDSGSTLRAESISYLEFLIESLFDDYEPSQFHPFKERLIAWLNNLDTTEDQQTLLSLLVDCFFVGRREFESLYRSAFQNIIFQWVSKSYELDPFAQGVEAEFRSIVDRAWVCPISDSLRINAFLKVNGLKSMDKRPDWRSLRELGDEEKIRGYVNKKGIKDLILLEDFTGSGTQSVGAVKFAARLLPDIRILVVPLIACPLGDSELKKIQGKFSNLSYHPALLIPKSEIHSFEDYESGNGTAVDKFLVRMNEKMCLNEAKDAFGFNQTGAKVVLYSNCPNNTLPIFHRESASWVPLFPRVERQK